MSTIHLHRTTTATPEQFLSALIDFGPGRSKLFGNSADNYLKVHHRGAADADVTDLWGGNSGHVYNFTRRPDGRTDVDAVVVRDGKNLKGRGLGLVLGTVGKGVLDKAFGNTVKAIEARNGVGLERP